MNTNGKYERNGQRGRGSSFRTSARILCIALAAVPAASVFAQNEYHRALLDYDQRREALPGNGSMYCVPTAYVDVLRFMALNGLGNLDKGYDNKYNSITSFIANMGNRMDTDASDGTNFSDGFDAVVDWIDDHSNIGYMHVGYSSGGDWGTGTMKNWMALGAMVRLGYGNYERHDGEWERHGGHAFAMAGYDYRGSDKYIYIANPASDDGNINAQGGFTYDKKLVKNYSFESEDHGNITHARYGTGTDTKRKIIDNMHAILPCWAGWMDAPFTTGVGDGTLWATLAAGALPPAKNTFHAVFPSAIDDGKNAPVREITIDIPSGVKDWCIDPLNAGIYVLGDDDSITHVDLVEKEFKRVATLKGARKLAVAGKKFELFVLQDGTAQDNLVRIEPSTGRQTTLKVAKGIAAIEPDQETFGIAALHPTEKKIFRIDPELRQARPQAIELPDGDGSVFAAMGRKGEVTLARSGGRTFTRASSGATARRFTLAQAPKLRAFQPFGKSRFILQEGTKLTTVDDEGKPTPGPFDRISAAGTIRVSHSWKGFSKADVSGPKWKEVPPTKDDD